MTYQDIIAQVERIRTIAQVGGAAHHAKSERAKLYRDLIQHIAAGGAGECGECGAQGLAATALLSEQTEELPTHV